MVGKNQYEPRTSGIDAGIELQVDVDIRPCDQAVWGRGCFQENGVSKGQIGDCERHSEGGKNSIRHAEV